MQLTYHYLILGGGLAGASAIEGIRQNDTTGSIGLLSAEADFPYHRPPLSKDLWWGKKTYDQIPVFSESYYRDHLVDLRRNTLVTSIHPEGRYVVDGAGNHYGYTKLLISTGSIPNRIKEAGPIAHTFRTAQDYLALARAVVTVEDFLIIGGGFIGVELAAALSHAGKKVTLLLQDKGLLSKVLPPDLSDFVTEFYVQKGIKVIVGDEPAHFEAQGDRVTVTTKQGEQVTTGYVIAGIGVKPERALADSAGLKAGDGIVVNRFLQTSRPEIYAAGDLALFPCEALGEVIRLEHWDNASAQGKCAGANMAGGLEPFTYLPYFYSDLFDLGFEAVGKLDGRMRTLAAWETPFRKGVVAYLENGVVQGILLWNQGKVLDWARKMVVDKTPLGTVEDLKAMLPVPAAV